MKKMIALVAGSAAALMLVGCAQHPQPMPHHSARQAGYSSKLGKLG